VIDWSEDKAKRLTELVCSPEHLSESKIAQVMTEEFEDYYSRDAVHNKITRLDLRSLINRIIPDIMPYYNKYRDIIESDGLIQKEFLVDTNQIVIEILKQKLKILHLGDLHIPFQNDEQIQLAVNRNLSADLVVTEELADCYSMSRFNKNLSIPFEIEIDNVVRYLEFLSDNFPLVFVMTGNHEKRISTTFIKGVPPSLMFLVEDNILKFLAKPFSNVIVVDQSILQINDAIFIHAEYFSKVDLKAGVNARNFLSEWKDVLGLEDYRLIVQAHTHMLGTTYRGGNTKIMESGCLSRVPDYAVNSFYSKPQTNGYIVVTQEEGVTNFDLTREYSFPTEKYVRNWSPLRR